MSWRQDQGLFWSSDKDLNMVAEIVKPWPQTPLAQPQPSPNKFKDLISPKGPGDDITML